MLQCWAFKMNRNKTWRIDKLPVAVPPNALSKIHLSTVPLLCTSVCPVYHPRNSHATHFAVPSDQNHLLLCWFETGCQHHAHPIHTKHFQTNRLTDIFLNVSANRWYLRIFTDRLDELHRQTALFFLFNQMESHLIYHKNLNNSIYMLIAN